jgi:hypothetical protein
VRLPPSSALTSNRAERDLASLAAHARRDPFLEDLAEQARDTGYGPVVGLLVNGMLVVGRLASPREFAEQLDSHNEWLVSQGEASGDPEVARAWAEARERVANMYVERVEDARNDATAVYAEVDEATAGEEVDLDALDPGLARRLVFAEAVGTLTLAEPHIHLPGAREALRVDVLRVHVAHVAAWWIALPDERGVTTTTIPGSAR